jgi:2-methylcitrate dehydratase PrpD
MHNPAAHSAVSDAFVRLARSTPNSEALKAAHHSIARARQLTAGASSTESPLHTLQDGASSDARLAAWAFGTALAKRGVASVATPVVAAVLTMATRIQASDDEIAASVALGTLASMALLDAVDSEEYHARWNVGSSLGVVGATLAVSRLIGLDEIAMRHALGIAATQASGLARNAREPMNAIEIGKAAADAIEASLLAKHGFTSAVASIDGRRGLAAIMAYRFDAQAITANAPAA